LIGSAPVADRTGVADLLGNAYAGGLRDVYLVCAAAAIVGGLLVLWLVRAAAPSQGHQPTGERQPAEPEAAQAH
jgi:hypothetical protein